MEEAKTPPSPHPSMRAPAPPILVKCMHGNDGRVFNIPSDQIGPLFDKLRSLYSFSTTTTFKLHYRDDEGDFIALETDEELQMAIKFYSKPKLTLRVTDVIETQVDVKSKTLSNSGLIALENPIVQDELLKLTLKSFKSDEFREAVQRLIPYAVYYLEANASNKLTSYPSTVEQQTNTATRGNSITHGMNPTHAHHTNEVRFDKSANIPAESGFFGEKLNKVRSIFSVTSNESEQQTHHSHTFSAPMTINQTQTQVKVKEPKRMSDKQMNESESHLVKSTSENYLSQHIDNDSDDDEPVTPQSKKTMSSKGTYSDRSKPNQSLDSKSVFDESPVRRTSFSDHSTNSLSQSDYRTKNKTHDERKTTDQSTTITPTKSQKQSEHKHHSHQHHSNERKSEGGQADTDSELPKELSPRGQSTSEGHLKNQQSAGEVKRDTGYESFDDGADKDDKAGFFKNLKKTVVNAPSNLTNMVLPR